MLPSAATHLSGALCEGFRWSPETARATDQGDKISVLQLLARTVLGTSGGRNDFLCISCGGQPQCASLVYHSHGYSRRHLTTPLEASCPGDYVVQHRKQRSWPNNANVGCTIGAVVNV